MPYEIIKNAVGKIYIGYNVCVCLIVHSCYSNIVHSYLTYELIVLNAFTTRYKNNVTEIS